MFYELAEFVSVKAFYPFLCDNPLGYQRIGGYVGVEQT